MTQEELCQELVDANVVRVDIIPANGSTFPIPFAVQNIASMSGQYPTPSPLPAGWASFATALLTMALTHKDGVDATMQEGVSHKSASSRETCGIVRTHTLQVPVDNGFQTLRQKEASLQNVDFHILLTTYDGTQYLAYGLPNSSQFALEETQGDSPVMTVKVSVKSMSGFIQLSTATS